MSQAVITVGLGFGDEGKGTIVDALCQRFQVDLVVRYSGGHQAAHTVVTPDGRSHVFAQLGAGSFHGIPTYLGPSVIVEPVAAMRELDAFVKINGGKYPALYVDRRCLVTTNYHKVFNRFVERIRRATNSPHGSCGVGIGATRAYWLKHGNEAITVRDLDLTTGSQQQLRDKLTLLRERLLLQAHECVEFSNNDSVEQFRDLCAQMSQPVTAVEKQLLSGNWHEVNSCSEAIGRATTAKPDDCHLVFEGAQGVLLDQAHGFHPHTTWSDVTVRPALEILRECGYSAEPYVLGITRCYATRHGDGPLPHLTRSDHRPAANEQQSAADSLDCEWPGPFRVGTLHLPTLKYARQRCGSPLDGIAVTCLDQVAGDRHYVTDEFPQVAEAFAEVSYSAARPRSGSYAEVIGPISEKRLLSRLAAVCLAPVSVCSRGPTYTHKTWLQSIPLPLRQ